MDLILEQPLQLRPSLKPYQHGMQFVTNYAYLLEFLVPFYAIKYPLAHKIEDQMCKELQHRSIFALLEQVYQKCNRKTISLVFYLSEAIMINPNQLTALLLANLM